MSDQKPLRPIRFAADMPLPQWLHSFVRLADTKSFTRAAQQLGVSQSTVSSHIQQLEAKLRRNLFARDTHGVTLTPDGDTLVIFARDIVEAVTRMDSFLSGWEPRGRIRFGACEDFALRELASVLASFAEKHGSVDVELIFGLSEVLYSRFDAGELDVIFVKRRAGDVRGEVAWSEKLVWVGVPGMEIDPERPLPLVMFPPPSITRAKALDALKNAGRSWRIACTSASLAGLHAAARAGLGIMPHSPSLVPPDLAQLPYSASLPELDCIEFVALGPGGNHAPISALIAELLASADNMRASSPPHDLAGPKSARSLESESA